MTRKRLLTIGHSYCVEPNRRLAHELARAGDWDVTVAGPARFRGDFAWHTLEAADGEPCTVVPVRARFAGRAHTMLYGRTLGSILAQPWDLVHCWEEPYVAAAAQIARRLRPEVPLVYATFQNIDKRYPPPFNWFERSVLDRADGLIAFGRTVAEVVERRQAARCATAEARHVPLAVLPPGVDVDAFRPDEARRRRALGALGWSPGTPTVGFLGRLVPAKGVTMLMAVLDRLETPWRALIVGGGPLEGDVAAWCRRHPDRTRLVVNAAHAEVPAYLNAMDLLCAPSRTTAGWREQFGRMLTEAFASGVPVVASTSGEIPHVVGDAGVLLPEDRPADWRAAVDALLGDPARRAALARRGRERAETVYSWRAVARAHLDFFEGILAGQTPARTGVRRAS